MDSVTDAAVQNRGNRIFTSKGNRREARVVEGNINSPRKQACLLADRGVEQPVLSISCGGMIAREYDSRFYTEAQILWLQAFEMETGFAPQVVLFERGIQGFPALQQHNLVWLQAWADGMIQRLAALSGSSLKKRRYTKKEIV